MADELTEPEEERHFGLVMPFVVCASKGGPFDDDAFVAGYECGKIDQALSELMSRIVSRSVTMTVHEANLPQLDLIAMNHGYEMTSTPSGVEGWATALFERADIERAER